MKIRRYTRREILDKLSQIIRISDSERKKIDDHFKEILTYRLATEYLSFLTDTQKKSLISILENGKADFKEIKEWLKGNNIHFNDNDSLYGRLQTIIDLSYNDLLTVIKQNITKDQGKQLDGLLKVNSQYASISS